VLKVSNLNHDLLNVLILNEMSKVKVNFVYEEVEFVVATTKTLV
jgi:hypothetical protein